MRPGISLHVMTKNPPMDRLAALIAFCQPYVAESVIVNTGMPDEHRARIQSWHRQYGMESEVVIVDSEFTDFSSTRNKGLALHRHEWTLVLDTDELPSAAMLAHVVYSASEQGRQLRPDAIGYLYLTYGWMDGETGPVLAHDWHTRLFRTEGSYFYRPVHELVAIGGESEIGIRETHLIPAAPAGAFLIHSSMPNPGKAQLYADLGESAL